MKILSIAVPCYNSQEYMRKCVDSLLKGGEDVEILIVDDGSKDDTLKIARDYEEKYPTIVKAIHQENKGTLANMLGINGTIHAAMALGMPEFRFSNYIDKKDRVETDL